MIRHQVVREATEERPRILNPLGVVIKNSDLQRAKTLAGVSVFNSESLKLASDALGAGGHPRIKCRISTDCSGSGINSAAYSPTFQYSTVSDGVRVVVRDGYLATADVSRYFFEFPWAEAIRPLFSFMFLGVLFEYLKLCFGFTSCPYYCSTWSAEFYQWFKWDPSLIEFESLDSLKKRFVLPVNLPFKIVNGQILDAHISNFKVSPDKKSAYVLYFIRATSTQFFSSNAYPMDKHFLYIPIEHVDLNASKLKFVPDLASSKVSSRVKLSGYSKGDRMVSSSLHTYQSHYGNPDENKDQSNTFNQYRFGLKIEREGYGYYSKLFIVLLVSCMIAFLSFFADKTDKLRITVGALFTTATNNYVLTRNIPDTSTISIAEFVDIISLATIFIIMCDQTILRFFTKENKELSDYTQWITFSLTLFFYILINFTIPIITK
jgi:hypothetical protein